MKNRRPVTVQSVTALTAFNPDVSIRPGPSSCRSGEIGIRKGLKIPRAHKARTGSIPVSGTI